MPSSRAEIISPALERIESIEDCRSVLDIGVGFGKWGALCREYLDVWKGRVRPEEWAVRIDGVEVFPAYRNPLWDLYTDVHETEALAWLREAPQSWDLVLMMDVLEHFTQADGFALLRAALARCAKMLIVAMPVVVRPQGEIYGNPHERHIAAWTPGVFDALCVSETGCKPQRNVYGKTALWSLGVAR